MKWTTSNPWLLFLLIKNLRNWLSLLLIKKTFINLFTFIHQVILIEDTSVRFCMLLNKGTAKVNFWLSHSNNLESKVPTNDDAIYLTNQLNKSLDTINEYRARDDDLNLQEKEHFNRSDELQEKLLSYSIMEILFVLFVMAIEFCLLSKFLKSISII